ncbi:cupin domain-containing protein [Fodinicola feengrottensis]|uniref:cupin domain-containing protein n=1 Tax=Fodinicola feengrottensis TaxID=435914 RepID=UPI0036F1DE2A
MPGEVSSDELWSHASVECAVVLSGVLTVDIRHVAYSVESGESITFDARTSRTGIATPTTAMSSSSSRSRPPQPIGTKSDG